MDRSHRASDPECFNPDGTCKRGLNARSRSRRYQAVVGILCNKLNAAGGELIDFGIRQTCLSRFGRVDGSYPKKPPSRPNISSRSGRAGGICRWPFPARFVLDNRFEAIEAAKTWTGAQAFLRAGGALSSSRHSWRQSGPSMNIDVSQMGKVGERPIEVSKTVEHGSPSLQRGEASHAK
jgi:hypothetical protein